MKGLSKMTPKHDHSVLSIRKFFKSVLLSSHKQCAVGGQDCILIISLIYRV